MSEKERPNYYAVIPGAVMYNPDLPPNAKLLYGAIAGLADKKGYSWASNNYFSSLFKCTPQAISSWINKLASMGFVKLEYKYKGKSITERKITIIDDEKVRKKIREEAGKEKKKEVPKVSIDIDRVSINNEEGINKCLKGYQQKIKENIISNNIPNNILCEPAKAGSTEVAQVHRHYQTNYNTLYQNGQVQSEKVVNNYGATGKLIKDHLKNLSLDDLIRVLDNAMKDEWAVEKTAYSLQYILGAGQVHKYLNAKINKGGYTQADLSKVEGLD